MLFLLLTLGSAFCFAIGNILEKSGISNTAKKVSLKTPLQFCKFILQNFHWWAGILFSAIATIGYYIAMAKYDLSLVQPMMVLNPVLTALFGFWILKEHLTKKIILAILCVLSGLLLSSKNMAENTGTQDLSALWLFTLLIVTLILIFRKFHKDLEASDSLIIGAGFGLSAAFYKSLAMDFMLDHVTLSMIPELLIDFRTLAYIALYGTAFLYSQIAFTRGRALYIIPFSAAIGAVLPILAGAFVFGENFPPSKIISVSLVLLGSFLFVAKRPRKKSLQNKLKTP